MAQGDLYRLLQRFLMDGVEMLVRRFFEQVTSTGNSEELLEAWYEDVTPELIAVMSADCALTGEDVINMDDPADFAYSSYTPVPGTRSGISAGTFDAWGFITTSTDRRIRSGGCRIPGVAVADVSDGEPIAAQLALLSALGVALTDNISDTAYSSEFAPKLYTPGNEATIGQPLAVDPVSTVFARYTTQNTRKKWRP